MENHKTLLPIHDERLSIWLKFFGLVISIFVFGFWGAKINETYQQKQLELEEMKILGSFIGPATSTNPATRKLVAQYFKTVMVSERLRERWEEYYKLASLEVKALEEKKEELVQLEKYIKIQGVTDEEQLENIKMKLDRVSSDLEVQPLNWTPGQTLYVVPKGMQYLSDEKGNYIVTESGQRISVE